MLSCVTNHLMNVDLFKIQMVNHPNGNISSKSINIQNLMIFKSSSRLCKDINTQLKYTPIKTMHT